MKSAAPPLSLETYVGRERDGAWREERSAAGQRGRVFGSVCIAVCLFAAAVVGLHPARAAAQNPIVIENQQPGSGGWLIEGNTGSDAVGQIRAYMSAVSVNKGGNIDFRVSVNPAQTYTIDVYRLGWYNGAGGRLMQHIGPLNGTQQPTCPTDATTGMIECNWAVGYTLATQTSWTDGLYVAVLTNAQNYQTYTHFVVRDDSRNAALMFQVTDNTWQAYNDYPYDSKTGKSLYAFNSFGPNTVGGSSAAVKVSFDRPYNYDGDCGVWGHCVLANDLNWVRWLEMSGYDVTYTSDLDAHLNATRLLSFKGIIIGVHSEYWSKAMYDNFIATRDAGVNLFFSGADAVYWQIRYEPSSSGVPNRVIVCYRDATLDPNTDPSLETVLWRDPPLNRPEQALMGVMFTNVVGSNAQGVYPPYIVNNSSNWVYAGSGFKNGDSVAGIVGYEADRQISGYTLPTAVTGTYTLLSHSPFTASSGADYSNSSIYQAPSGAWVFASGTINWAYALDDFTLSNVVSFVDARIQKTTSNILGQFLGNAPPDFTLAASPASQTVAPGSPTSYSVTITPKGTFAGNVNLSVSGLPTGATGSFAPNPATSSSTLSVTTGAATPIGAYTLTITGVSGTLTHTSTVTLVVATPDFALSASPASQTVLQGGSTNYNTVISPISGFSGQVTLSVTGLPSGAGGTFAPNPATSSSTLTVTTGAATPLGTYTLTITGVSGTLTHTTTATLVVSTPDFALSASPASQTTTQGGSTTYGTTITPMLGFGGQVTLSVTGLPTGATGSFSPNPATTSSTLSVTTSASTPTGTSTLTITGVSGALTHATTVSLTVNPAGVAFDNKVSSDIDFGVTTKTTPAFTIGSNPNRAAMIMVAMSANTATNITASLGGVSGTLIPGTDSGTAASARTMIFQVINPPSGSKTATVSWTGSMNADVGVITVSGANQTTPTSNGTFSASSSSSTATTSVTITSNPGDLTASIGYTANSWKTPFTNQTLKWGVDSTEVGGDIGPGTGTTTHTWTDSFAFQTHAVSGANFKAVSLSDFTLSASPPSQTVAHGNPTSYGVTINPTNGFAGQVTLGVTGLPTGAGGSFNTNPATTSSTLSVTTDATTTPAGSYTLTITGVSGSLTHTTTVTLVVTAPDFTVSASPSSQTVTQGGSTSYGVAINPTNGFAGQVTLSVTGLPTGAGGSFATNPATTTSTLSVTTDPTTTPAGTYILTITGVSGTLTHSTTVSLVVNTPDFSLSPSPASQTVARGNPTSYGVTINPTNGFSGQVTLSVTGLPTGAGGGFSPNPATASSTLSVTTDPTITPAGTYTLTITGVSGSLTHTTTVSLVVTAPDFTLSPSPASQTVARGSGTSYGVTINPTNGFAGQVTLSVTGLPTGAGGSFAPNPATTSSTLSVTTDPTTTPAGTYTLTITGVSGSLTHTTTVSLVVTAPDFTLSPSPASQTVNPGGSTSYGVTINPTNGFAGQVTLSVTGLPTGAGGSFNTNPATSTSTLSLTTDSATTPPGTYTLTITGVSGSLTHTSTVTLVVNTPNFSLSPTPASQTVTQGNATSYGVTINPTNGFAGQVTLSVTGLPTGAGGSFAPNPATTSSTLSVTTIATTPTGTYTLTITGVSGSLTHTTTVTLVVAASGTKQATTTALSSSLNPSLVGQAVTFTATVTSAAGGTPTGTVTFKQGTTVLGTGTLSSGQATFTSTTLVAGTKNYTAAYGGDANYKTSTSTALSQTVNKNATTTTVTSSLNPSVYGQTVTFTATVSSTVGAPPDGETVTFKRGSTTLGTGTLSGGIATLSTNALTVGTPSITAQYATDPKFLASTSAAITQTVSKAATTSSLVSAPNPSAVGQSVTFTVTLTSSTGAIPTGSVSFKQGTTTLGTGTLDATGTATFSTTTLTAGSHAITAVYAATTNFLASTSTSVTQVVQ